MILGGPHKLLQTIYIDDTDALEAVTIDETSGKIAACGGPDVFVYQPYGIKGETLKVRGWVPARVAGGRNWITTAWKLETDGCADRETMNLVVPRIHPPIRQR